MLAQEMKTLELHNPTIQSLIKAISINISQWIHTVFWLVS